jgi:biopolymer transport protein ExbB
MHDLERAGIEIVNLIEDSKTTSNIVEFHQVSESPTVVPMIKNRTRGLKA